MYRYQQFLLNKDTHTIWLCCQIPCLILYAKWDESGSWKKVSFLKQWRSGFKLACLAGAQKRKRVVTSANSEAAPRSLFWAAKGLNELRRVRFELIGKKTVFFFFKRPNMARTQISEHKWGPRTKISALSRPWCRLHRLRFEIFSSTPLLIQTFLKCFPQNFKSSRYFILRCTWFPVIVHECCI